MQDALVKARASLGEAAPREDILTWAMDMIEQLSTDAKSGETAGSNAQAEGSEGRQEGENPLAELTGRLSYMMRGVGARSDAEGHHEEKFDGLATMLFQSTPRPNESKLKGWDA
jgi:hypothetical protein